MTDSTRQSRYLDGTVPGMRNPRFYQSDDAVYIQPDIEVREMGEGAEIEQENKSICSRLDSSASGGITDWLKRNKNTILTVATIYGGYRILRR